MPISQLTKQAWKMGKAKEIQKGEKYVLANVYVNNDLMPRPQ